MTQPRAVVERGRPQNTGATYCPPKTPSKNSSPNNKGRAVAAGGLQELLDRYGHDTLEETFLEIVK